MLLQVMNQNVTSTYMSIRTKINRQCQIVRCVGWKGQSKNRWHDV